MLTHSQYEAYKAVDARLDDGARFQEKCRFDPEFHQAVEEARQLRAYAPGTLRKKVVEYKI